jgi:hypothetical protein
LSIKGLTLRSDGSFSAKIHVSSPMSVSVLRSELMKLAARDPSQDRRGRLLAAASFGID